MKDNLILVSDPHGCFYTLQRLLLKCPKDAQLVLCGDLVDRGPHSRQLVEWAMKEKIPTVMGNHDHMMLHYHERINSKIYDSRDIWLDNGGDKMRKQFASGKVSDAILDWVQALPTHLIYGKLLVSHTGHALAKPRKVFGQLEPPEMHLWWRDTTFPDDGYYRVFGHTSADQAIITDKWAMIDTGAAYKHRGQGNMTAFHWPSKQTFVQPYDETPL